MRTACEDARSESMSAPLIVARYDAYQPLRARCQLSKFMVRGPLADIEALHGELSTEFASDWVQLGAIAPIETDIFDSGEFGSSPLVEFAIEYGSAIAAVGTVASAKAIYTKIRNRKNVQVISEPKSDDEGNDGSQ